MDNNIVTAIKSMGYSELESNTKWKLFVRNQTLLVYDFDNEIINLTKKLYYDALIKTNSLYDAFLDGGNMELHSSLPDKFSKYYSLRYSNIKFTKILDGESLERYCNGIKFKRSYIQRDIKIAPYLNEGKTKIGFWINGEIVDSIKYPSSIEEILLVLTKLNLLDLGENIFVITLLDGTKRIISYNSKAAGNKEDIANEILNRGFSETEDYSILHAPNQIKEIIF